MNARISSRPMEILLVEDNPADAELVIRAFKTASRPLHLSVVDDGAQALDYLRRRTPFEAATRPDIVLLDLSLPGKTGHEILKEIKADPDLKDLPVIIYSGSSAPRDVRLAYLTGANSYVQKPVDLDDFFGVVSSIENFWLNTALLPAPSREPRV